MAELKDDFIDLDEEKEEETHGWDWFKSKGKKILDWISRNKEIVIMGFLGLFGAFVGVADSAKKAERRKSDHERIYRTIYDGKHRNYVVSKKDIKPHQQEEIDRRIDDGENIYDACRKAGIKLKR